MRAIAMAIANVAAHKKIELTRSGKDVLHRVKREGCTENKASPTCSH
jgi:hypothetical protein